MASGDSLAAEALAAFALSSPDPSDFGSSPAGSALRKARIDCERAFLAAFEGSPSSTRESSPPRDGPAQTSSSHPTPVRLSLAIHEPSPGATFEIGSELHDDGHNFWGLAFTAKQLARTLDGSLPRPPPAPCHDREEVKAYTVVVDALGELAPEYEVLAFESSGSSANLRAILGASNYNISGVALASQTYLTGDLHSPLYPYRVGMKKLPGGGWDPLILDDRTQCSRFFGVDVTMQVPLGLRLRHRLGLGHPATYLAHLPCGQSHLSCSLTGIAVPR